MRVDHPYHAIPEAELDERAEVMLEQFGGLASAGYSNGAMLFTVGTWDDVLDCERATVLYWRCDQ